MLWAHGIRSQFGSRRFTTYGTEAHEPRYAGAASDPLAIGVWCADGALEVVGNLRREAGGRSSVTRSLCPLIATVDADLVYVLGFLRFDGHPPSGAGPRKDVQNGDHGEEEAPVPVGRSLRSSRLRSSSCAGAAIAASAKWPETSI